MYSPSYNQVHDQPELLEFMRANSFALFVTGTGGALHASHLPVTVEARDGSVFIHSHMARNNPQWKEFFDDDVLVVFSGAHAYVSPRWYAADQVERVPTWNYAAVHAYGKVALNEDRKAKHASQRRLVQTLDPQWLPTFDALSQAYVDKMLEGIVTFDIEVSRLETRWKLSQNRGRQEMELIAAQLEKSGDPMEKALAALTRKHLVEG
jgi:transcriptional regulator